MICPKCGKFKRKLGTTAGRERIGQNETGERVSLVAAPWLDLLNLRHVCLDV